MLTTKVALVPYDDNVQIASADGERVAEALDQQIARDVTPAWQVSATVSWFDALDAIPDDHVALVVIRDYQGLPGHGFHLSATGRPFALVTAAADSDTWAQYASHELIELLCDPSGTRTTPGPSLLDKQKGDGSQGTVEYLVEVCDPCEDSSYHIDLDGGAVEVSDFVLPSYYTGRSDGPFTHQGRISQPFQLLTGGYISWQTRFPGGVWQALAPDTPDGAEPSPCEISELKIDPLAQSASEEESDIGPRISRQFVGVRGRKGKGSVEFKPSGATGPPLSYAEALRRDIETFLTLLATPPPTVDDLIGVLSRIQRGEVAGREALTNLGITVPKRQPEISDAELVGPVIEALKQQQKVSRLFGEDMFSAGWLMHLIG